MRRISYLLLTVFLVQLSGIRMLCASPRIQTHACCPMSAGSTLPQSSSLPDCCLTWFLNYQGSITETQNPAGQEELTAQSGTVSVSPAVTVAAISAPVRQPVLPSVSPPLSPLAQTCLLLI